MPHADLTRLAIATATLAETFDDWATRALSEHLTSSEYMAIVDTLAAAGHDIDARRMATAFIHGDQDCRARIDFDDAANHFVIRYYSAPEPGTESYATVSSTMATLVAVAADLGLRPTGETDEQGHAFYNSHAFR